MTQIILDLSGLDQLIRESGTRADDIIGKLAGDTAAHIVTHFNTQSPSPAGEPPGVDTGNLKGSIRARKVKDQEWVAEDGVPYGVHLEYGTRKMASRPFVLPAVEQIAANAPDDLRKMVEVK